MLERLAGSAELVVAEGRCDDFAKGENEGVIVELSEDRESVPPSGSEAALTALVKWDSRDERNRRRGECYGRLDPHGRAQFVSSRRQR